MIRSAVVGLVAACSMFISAHTTSAAPLTVDYVDSVTGWEWAALTETTGLTWNQVNTACSQDGLTPCSSNIGARELIGWTWATQNQVRDLFVNASALTAPQMADYNEGIASSTWAPEFLTAFTATLTNSSRTYVQGLTSNTHSSAATRAIVGLMMDQALSDFDVADVTEWESKGNSDGALGVWLHRPAVVSAAVPEPATLLMFGSGLAGVYTSLRRKRRN